MKFSVQVDLTDTEIKELASDVGFRLIFKGLRLLNDELNAALTPETVQRLFEAISQLGPTFETLAKKARAGARGGPNVPPWAQGQGPFGFTPNAPPPKGGWRDHAPASPSPINGSSPVVEHCFPIEEGRHIESGWCCCKCATYNGLQRTACRNCAHTRCGAVITPPPGPAPEPPKEA